MEGVLGRKEEGGRWEIRAGQEGDSRRKGGSEGGREGGREGDSMTLHNQCQWLLAFVLRSHVGVSDEGGQGGSQGRRDNQLLLVHNVIKIKCI